MRNLPDVSLSPCSDTYARFLCEGFDSLQEAFALQPSLELVELLDRAKKAATALQDNLEGTVELTLGPERVKMHATGAKGGVRWRVSNDDFQLLIGSPKRDWAISCRYLSAGLWEHGPSALRARVLEALRPYTRQVEKQPVVVSRADWCFDFYSPALTQELWPGKVCDVVAHSSVKKFERESVTVGEHSQTITIGSKSGLQIQLYDKSREIDEASGKTWFWPIWVSGLDGEWPWKGNKPRDVWRLECRFSGDFLRDRNIRQPNAFEAALPDLIAEALYTRRLTVPNGDSHRERRPMHPIWSEAARIRGSNRMLPIGRKVTGLRDALVDRGISQLAGNFRSLAELDGGYGSGKVVELFKAAQMRIEQDPNHQRKLEAARNRYSDVDEAR